jgi:2',3'-cyclic-nucleotide 2'-phosphodiesterase / 3'-nucleotidase
MKGPCLLRRGFLLLLAPLLLALSAAAAPRRVTLTLLSTTDIHGHVEPWNYLTGRPANLGLAKIATLVERIRKEKRHVLLLDCGDATEGTPLAYYFARRDPGAANPTIAVMNAMHYDAMALGNHEFNFGLASLWRAKGEAHFPWLAANVEQVWPGGVRHFKPYVIRNVAGIRIGIVGFVTPGIPHWEVPSHYRGYRFEPIVAAARRIVPELRPKVDLLVALVHSGLDRDPATGRRYKELYPEENVAWELAEDVPEIDVLFFGHTHRELPEKIIHGVLLSQAKNWGESLAEAEVTMSREPNGRWGVAGKHSRTIRVTSEVAADPAILKLAAPYQAKVERYLGTPIAVSPAALSGALGRLRDDPLIDLIHQAQLAAGHADVSFATLLDPEVYFPAGTITIRQVFALEPYDDELDTVEMTGAELKQALEHAASFYPPWPFPPGRVALPSYSADSAEGVSYRVNLAQPVGERIEELRYHGKPLDPQARLRVAVNSYRVAGGGGYAVYRGLPVVLQTKEEVVEVVIAYLKRTGKVPVEADQNWALEPREAAQALFEAAEDERRAASGAARPGPALLPPAAPASRAAADLPAAAGR